MELAPFDLNIRHLRALPEVTAHGSLNVAARAVGLSQPALTQGLGKLERQLGLALFDRRSDGVTPTPAGEVMAERSRLAFTHLATALRHGGAGFSRPEQLATATQLKSLLALADAGSFAAAAAASGLTRAAVHRAVRDLEQVCGCALAERRGQTVVLTAFGRRVARGVRLAAAEVSAGILTVAGHPQGSGRIVIGAMPLSRALILPHALSAFIRTSPRTKLEIVEGSWRELIEPLRDGIVDLLIGALRDEQPVGVVQRPLFQDDLAVVARAGHPLAARGTCDLNALASYDWVVGSPGTPLRARWGSMFAGHAPAAPVECGSVMIIRGLLASTDLLSLLSPDQVALEIASGMLTTIAAPIARGRRIIGVTTRQGWRPTLAQLNLLEMIEEAARVTRVKENE